MKNEKDQRGRATRRTLHGTHDDPHAYSTTLVRSTGMPTHLHVSPPFLPWQHRGARFGADDDD